MSKHHRTAGADFQSVQIGDKQYTLRPLTVGVYASMEAFIASRRPDPLQIASEAVKRLPPSQHDAVWRAAMDSAVSGRIVTSEEAAAFENSVDGLAWKVWQCVREDHPEVNTLEAARELLLLAGEEHFERLARATELASGEADLKKSSGQAEEERAADLAGQ